MRGCLLLRGHTVCQQEASILILDNAHQVIIYIYINYTMRYNTTEVDFFQKED